MSSSTQRSMPQTAASGTTPEPAAPTPIININALTPAETEEAVKKAGVAKVRLRGRKALVSAMFAGAFVGFGALFFLIVTCDPALTWGPKRFVGGLAFCLGLVMVLCCGGELFTGNSLMVSDLVSRKVTWREMARNWVIVWIGNFAGAALLLALIVLAGTLELNDGAVGDLAVATAAAKVSPAWGTLFVRGMLCNVLVCLAVRIGFAARSVADKVLGIILPISGFVAMGFEHCVANMFFLPLGLVAKAMGYGAADPATASLDVLGSLANMSAATLGNIVGGSVFVALAYWYISTHPSR